MFSKCKVLEKCLVICLTCYDFWQKYFFHSKLFYSFCVFNVGGCMCFGCEVLSVLSYRSFLAFHETNRISMSHTSNLNA